MTLVTLALHIAAGLQTMGTPIWPEQASRTAISAVETGDITMAESAFPFSVDDGDIELAPEASAALLSFLAVLKQSPSSLHKASLYNNSYPLAEVP